MIVINYLVGKLSWTITHCLLGSMITVRAVDGHLFLFSDLLNGKESILAHLNSFRHVTDGGVFCKVSSYTHREKTENQKQLGYTRLAKMVSD